MKMSENDDLWEQLPLFAPGGTTIPKLSPEDSAEKVTSAVGALSHLLYDEETPMEASELLRDEGNRHFKRGKRGYRNAIAKYTEAINAAGGVPEAVAPALLNRSLAEFKSQNYGRALRDVEESLSLMPGNVKAHYRAVLCALELEKLDTATQHCEQALNLLENDATPQARKDKALFKQQRLAIEKAKAKSGVIQTDRQIRMEAEEARRQSIAAMQRRVGITMGLPLFGQQRRYSKTEPECRDGVWCWPVLLVYPEEVVSPGRGDQSDFLEDIDDTTTMADILNLVFGEGLPPPEWDAHRMYSSPSRLEMRYRTQWTMELSEADSDEEETFCGSALPRDEVGHWMNIRSSSMLRDVLGKRNYITPMFPVLYVVPKEVEIS